MRLLETIMLAGFRRIHRDSRTSTGWTVRLASGQIQVELDEEGLRGMIHQALISTGRKCKSGPLHVRFVGEISVREPHPQEIETLPPGWAGDDVFLRHVWTSRPR